MARARNIKPAFFDNVALGKLSGDARILFIALWQLADRQGVLEYNPALFRRYAFGYRDDITENDVVGYITDLSRLDNGDTLVIKQYGSKRYLIITNFERHQNPHHTEKKGVMPDIKHLINSDKSDLTVTTPLCNGYNPADSLLLNPDSSNYTTSAYAPEEEKQGWAHVGAEINNIVKSFGFMPMETPSLVSSWLAWEADPETDIYPTIRRLCESAKKQGKTIHGLKYFNEAVVEAIAQRKLPMPEVTKNEPSRNPSKQHRPSAHDNFVTGVGLWLSEPGDGGLER